MNYKTVGKNIKKYRVARKISTKTVCLFLGVSPALYVDVEKGEKMLTIDQLKKLASLFGITLSELEEENRACSDTFSLSHSRRTIGR